MMMMRRPVEITFQIPPYFNFRMDTSYLNLQMGYMWDSKITLHTASPRDEWLVPSLVPLRKAPSSASSVAVVV